MSKLILIAMFGLAASCSPQDVEVAEEPSHDPVNTPPDTKHLPKVIFDTDIAADCDDAGALAVLHALADKGEVEIAGMMVSMPVEYGASALDAINTYYRDPDIPIGTLKKTNDEETANLRIYNKDITIRFPNDLKHATNAPAAMALYRQLLSSHDDKSLTIVTVGPLTNLYNLMRSKADTISALSGMDLIKQKVKVVVIAGGRLPEGSSYNFYMAPEETDYVINNWPAEAWFVPNQLGDSVLTGERLIAEASTQNPVRMAYKLYQSRYPENPFRPSWDQMGVLIAVRGTAGLFKTTSKGSVIASKGKVRWEESRDKNHVWFQNNSTTHQRLNIIRELMLQAPK